MRTIAIIQARMSSTRLPGKVLMNLAGKTVLEHVATRIQSCRTIQEVIVATSTDSSDDPIELLGKKLGINIFRGQLDDVLDRYYQAAKKNMGKSIVRITADCPAIDPVVVDAVVTGFIAGNYDYYCLGGEFPDGLDCEVISMEALTKAWENANLQSEREHVCPYIHTNHKDLFKTGYLKLFNNLNKLRWTLDEPKDYQLLKTIFENLYPKNNLFLTSDILNFLDNHPALLEINNSITRNAGLIKSLENDKNINATK